MHCNSILRKATCFVSIILIFAGCSTKPDTGGVMNDPDDNSGYASDASRLEWINNDVISMADAAGFFYNGAYMRTTFGGICATVATDTISVPHTVIIRFGASDVTCLDGRKRRGAIVISYNGRYADTNQVHMITYDNYYVNENQLTGSVQTIRVDTTVTGNWYYKVLVNDSLNTSQDPMHSQISVWKGSLVRRWVSGAATGDRLDDIFSVSGSATLTRPNGHTYSFGISAPLQFAVNCDYAEAGIVNVSGYKGARRLDYGNGSCDPNASLYIGTNSYAIVLAK
jgi:hypothetical protein